MVTIMIMVTQMKIYMHKEDVTYDQDEYTEQTNNY